MGGKTPTIDARKLAVVPDQSIRPWIPRVLKPTWCLRRAFLKWCAAKLGKALVKHDTLLKEQLPAWFAGVRAIKNPVMAACLQAMLRTGVRSGEVPTLRREDTRAGLKQADEAKRMGMTQSATARLEDGWQENFLLSR